MKSKGIVIELTALLDVILIMLFWLMMTAQQNSETIKQEAESRIMSAEQRVENAEDIAENAVEEAEKLREEMEEMRLETEKEIAEAWKKSASINENATANQLALDNFERGMIITINLRYGDSGMVDISDYGGKLGQVDVITEENIAESLISSLEKTSATPDGVVLCAMIYDGSQALYRDVKALRTAVGEVKDIYPNLYCTYINLKEKEKTQ